MGYLGAGVFNDSVVSVAPVFWVVLGAGMRQNALLGAVRSGRSSTRQIAPFTDRSVAKAGE
jgi:hypothetical protein